MTTKLGLASPDAIGAGLVAFVALLAFLMPRLTRPDLYFAVTVPADFRATPGARAILRRYRAWVAAHSLIALALALGHGRLILGGGPLLGIGWLNAGWFAAYYGARRRVLPHAIPPTTVREAELKPRSARLPGGLALQLGPFTALAAAGLYLESRWSELPQRFPVHWGWNGRPNRWAARNFAGVYGPLLTGAVIAATLALLAWLLLRQSRQIRAGGAAGEAERRFRHAVLAVLLATEYFLALAFISASLLPLAAEPALGQTPPGLVAFPALTLAFVAAVAVILIRMGQGGTRLAGAAAGTRPEPPETGPVGDRSLDRCWKGGLLYFNRDDPALFVEKRFGIGYTVNFGRPAAWVVLALLVLVPLALALWLERAGS
jgi:uncharacterized membrane protein